MAINNARTRQIKSEIQANYERWLAEDLSITLSRRQLIALREAAVQVVKGDLPITEIMQLSAAIERIQERIT